MTPRPPVTEIHVAVDPRVELLSIVFRLAGNPEYNRARILFYAEDVDRCFARFRNHPAIATARQLCRQRGISFDAPMKMAVCLNDVESVELRASPSGFPLGQDPRWTEGDAQAFLRDLRSFVQESSFQTFIEDHQPLYRIACDRLGQVLRDRRISEWLDSFFGCRSGARLIAVAGMLNGGACYGPSIQLVDGREEIYSIVGAGACDEAGRPRFDPAIVLTAVHEFCHSYTNPLVDRHREAMKPSGERIFTLLRTEMGQQAYGNWTTMMKESLVRACVVRYVAATEGADPAAAEAKRNVNRKFFWTEGLAHLFAEYETSRQIHPTLDAFMARIVPFFDTYAAERLAQDLATLPEERKQRFERLKAKSPKVVSITPADGAANVSPDTPAIVITFDRPMKKSNLALMTIGMEFPAPAGKATFDDSGKVLTMAVKLKAQTEYGFGLNGEGFYSMQDEQGNFLAPVVVRFKTGPAR
jgi:hypothetical protein